MAAYSSFHILAPSARSQRASVFATLCGVQRRSTQFAATVARVAIVAGEIALFLWAVLAFAFWLLILVGVFSPR